MSFYFYIKTDQRPEPDDVLSALARPEVEVIKTVDGDLAFYIPGQSLRGAMVYPRKDGYEVGVNAFTPACDAILARDLAACLSKLTQAGVKPEDSDVAVSSDEVALYGGAAWVADRMAEAHLVAHRPKGNDPHSPLTIFATATRSMSRQKCSKALRARWTPVSTPSWPTGLRFRKSIAMAIFLSPNCCGKMRRPSGVR